MQLKLLQLNTWHGAIVFEPTIQFLKDQNADILHLQEVYTNVESRAFPDYPNYSLYEYIQNNFDYPYSAFSKTFDVALSDGSTLPIGNATFSRYPIEESKTVYVPGHHGFSWNTYKNYQPEDFSHSPANFLSSTINIDGKLVKSINMHGVWGFDGEDNERRLQMRDLVLQEIENVEYVLVSGDFNTVPETQTMSGIRTKLNDVFYQELETTFNSKRWKHKDLKFVVDYIFTSKNIEVFAKEAPQVDISDHMPLIIKFSL